MRKIKNPLYSGDHQRININLETIYSVIHSNVQLLVLLCLC